MSINKVILVGNLGQSPEIKYNAMGNPICKFSVATNEKWIDKSGKKQEKTEWNRVVTFGKLAEICNQYLEKGKLVYVEGKLQTSSWDKEDGSKGYMTEINASIVEFL